MGRDRLDGIAMVRGSNLPILVAERSKASVCGRSLAGVAGSNPPRGLNVCVVCCTVKYKRQRQGNQEKDVQI